MTLEQTLAQIAKDNAFTSIDVGRMPVGDRIVWTACGHWDGFSARGIPCDSGHSDASIRDALDDMIRKAQADRTPPVVLPEVIPVFAQELAA